ncbi:MAG: ABC transporter ATP-binding protein/permease, partial [Clostridia bacterium]|nr:ABC transporter ATP-binding protein/permease [Clostridia bacterium]
LVFIVGKSGSGKSTLLNMLGGLDAITSGEIEAFGNELHKYSESKLYTYRSNVVGFIFQDFHLLDDLTVGQNIGLSLSINGEKNDQAIDEIIDSVGLSGYKQRYPDELSGGQKQRVAIARALVKNPSIILADEPTGNLDSNTTEQVIKLIKKISMEKLVVVVSHNLFDAFEYADRIIELSEGRIINDLELNKAFDNSIKVSGDTITLPMLKRFNEEELKELLDLCKREEVTKIEQKDDKFILYKGTQAIDGEQRGKEGKGKKQKNLSFKESCRFSLLFGKRRILNLVFSAVVASLIICVLALAQSIALFDDKEMAVETLKADESSYIIRKAPDFAEGEVKAKDISQEEIDTIQAVDPSATIYKLYMNAIYINGYNIGHQSIPNIASEGLHIKETFGTLETNEEYAKQLLGVDELEIYTGDCEYRGGGAYITDFAADSLIYYGKAKSYDEALGDKYEGTPGKWTAGYVNGIINTNYKERFKEELEKVSRLQKGDQPTEDVLEFYDYITQALAIGYSFESDYKTAGVNDTYARNYVYTRDLYINSMECTNTIQYVTKGSYFGYDLASDEVVIDVEAYNTIFGTAYNYTTCESFVPHTINFVSRDYNKDVTYTKQMKVVRIGKVDAGKMMVADNIFLEYRERMFHCYGLYIESDNMGAIIKHTVDNGYVSIAIKMSAIQTMAQAVTVFNKFFELIVIILLVGCVFIITSFGVKNIRSNMYEVGVMKALGCRLSRFIVIFGLQTMAIALMTVVLSTVGFAVFAGIANDILVESLRTLATGQVVLDLSFIKFDWMLVLFNSLIVVAISLISTLIPLIILKRIKPIAIIKAKE